MYAKCAANGLRFPFPMKKIGGLRKIEYMCLLECNEKIWKVFPCSLSQEQVLLSKFACRFVSMHLTLYKAIFELIPSSCVCALIKCFDNLAEIDCI